MAELTGIAWTDSTFNPWIGCTKIGPGCDNCYAEAQDKRFGGGHWGVGAPRRMTSQKYWAKPLLWNERAGLQKKRHLVFCASQADVFDNAVDPEWRASLFRLIAKTPHLTWQLLTKRIGNVSEMVEDLALDRLPANVWLGATVVTQEEADRDIPKLARIPATVRFLSIEPQIERIDLCEAFGIWWNQTMDCWESSGSQIKRPVDWVITGGESKQYGKCRPYKIEWAASLVRVCKGAGVPVFVKQLGHDANMEGYTGKGDNPIEWPESIRVREFPHG